MGAGNDLGGLIEALAHQEALLGRGVPQDSIIAAPYEPEGRARADWHLTEAGVAKVPKEWESIPEYLRQGDLAEVQKEDGAYA